MADGFGGEVSWSEKRVSRLYGLPDRAVRDVDGAEAADDPPRSPVPQGSPEWASGLAGVRETRRPPGKPVKKKRRRTRIRERAAFLRMMHPEGIEWGENIEDYEPEALRATHRKIRSLFGARRHYFNVRVDGFTEVPDRPVMLVSNHSGGTTLLDAFGLLFAWYEHFGFERPIHPAGHEMLYATQSTAKFFAQRGVVRANRRNAMRVLSEWRRDLLVYPGGDVDVWRPHRDRYKVRFAGRTGYAKLALQAGVPVVPVAHAGAHDTLRVLTDGHRLAKAVKLDKIARAHVWPVHLSLPWGVAVGPVPHLPTPTTLRYRVGAAIWPHQVGAPRSGLAEPSQARVEEFDARVRAAIQGGLDGLADERA